MRLSGAPVARVISCVFIVALPPYYSRNGPPSSSDQVEDRVAPATLIAMGGVESFRLFGHDGLSDPRLFRTTEHCPGPDQPRMEARAVCHETRWTNSSPAAVSLTAA